MLPPQRQAASTRAAVRLHKFGDARCELLGHPGYRIAPLRRRSDNLVGGNCSMNYKKLAALGASLAVAGGMIVSASGATGAYFSQSAPGTISGQLGSITVSTSGGNGSTAQDFSWSNMLPGVPNSATVDYQNTSVNAEDIYLVFQNQTALSALNNLGTYGEVHISAAGNGTPNGALFDSANLNDRASTCGPFSPSGCWPVPNVIKVASGIGGGTTGSVTFAFNYAGKLSSGEGGQFSVPGGWPAEPRDLCPELAGGAPVRGCRYPGRRTCTDRQLVSAEWMGLVQRARSTTSALPGGYSCISKAAGRAGAGESGFRSASRRFRRTASRAGHDCRTNKRIYVVHTGPMTPTDPGQERRAG